MKHIDWERIGWTFGIPLIIVAIVSFITFIPYFLGNWVAGNEIENYAIAHGLTDNSFNITVKWITGIASIIAPVVVGFIIYQAILIIARIKDFYYH